MKQYLPNLAMLKRSVMLDSLSLATYLVRSLLLALALIALYFLGYEASNNRSATGLAFFGGIMFLNLVFITISAVYYFSSMITEEKDNNTLGLTLMTGISPFSLLANKYGSRFLMLLFIIAMQMPFTFLAVTLGGISLEQIMAAYLALAANIFMITAMATFCSVCCRTTQRAFSFSIILLVLFYGGHGIIFIICHYIDVITEQYFSFVFYLKEAVVDFWPKLSPFYRLNDLFNATGTVTLTSMQFYSNMMIGCFFLVTALVIFNSFIQQQLAGKARKLKPVKKKKVQKREQLRRAGKGRVWNPKKAVQWKEYHFHGGGRNGLLYRFLFYAITPIAIIGLTKVMDSNFRDDMLVIYARVMFVIGAVLLPVEIAYLLNSLFSKEIKDKTYQSLIILPLTLKQLIMKKLLGVLYLLIPWTINMLVSLMIFAMFYPDSWVGFEPVFIYLLCVALYASMLLFVSVFAKNGAFIISLLLTVMLFFIFNVFDVIFKF
jgi:hypothetical protein